MTRILAAALVLLATAGAKSPLPVPPAAPAPPATALVPVPAELASARAALLEQVRSGAVPSLALGVVRSGTVVWEETLGWADRAAGVPATPRTLYALASVSKSITATGALALVAQGRLRLDAPVERLLGGLRLEAPSGVREPVRVAHLLAHTSGIPHLWHYEYPDRPATVVGRRRLIGESAFVAAPPGERYLYSNLGYGVLAEVVERAGGAPFQQVMERVLFGPLAMVDTTVDAWVGQGGAARGYDGDGAPIPYPYRLAPDGGAGFFASLDDLLRYARFHLGAAGPAGPREAAIVRTLGELPPGGHYLRGWGVVSLPRATVLISDGQAAGGTAAVVLVPESRLGVVALTNATGGPAAESAVALLDALLPGFADQFGAAVGGIEAEIAAPGVAPTGRYSGTLSDGERRLAVRVDFTAAALPLLQLGDDRYLLQQVGWERGAWMATAVGSLPVGVGRERRHRLQLTLWARDGELWGVAQEEVADGRPGVGVPHRLVLTPER